MTWRTASDDAQGVHDEESRPALQKCVGNLKKIMDNIAKRYENVAKEAREADGERDQKTLRRRGTDLIDYGGPGR